MRTIKLTKDKEVLYISLREFKEKFPGRTHLTYTDLIKNKGTIEGWKIREVEITVTAKKEVKYVYSSYETAARLLKIDEQEIRDAVANHKKVQGYTFTYDEHEK